MDESYHSLLAAGIEKKLHKLEQELEELKRKLNGELSRVL